MATPVRAIVFDFDGLLMDTESTNIDSWEREWGRWGLALDRAAFFAPHGGDVTAHRYALLAEAVGPQFDRVLSEQRRTRDRDEMNAALLLAPGLAEWLSEAASLGLMTEVASSSPAWWVRHHLAHVDALGRFDDVIGGDQVSEHKPAPDVYLLALARLGVTGDEAVAVEDTPHGVDAAHAAGLRCIAIPNPHVAPDAIAHADLVLSSGADCPLREALGLLSHRV